MNNISYVSVGEHGNYCIIYNGNNAECHINIFGNEAYLPNYPKHVYEFTSSIKSINAGANMVCGININDKINCMNTKEYGNNFQQRIDELDSPQYISVSDEAFCILHNKGDVTCAVLNSSDAVTQRANSRQISLFGKILCIIKKNHQMECFNLLIKENLDRSRYIYMNKLIQSEKSIRSVSVSKFQFCFIQNSG